MTLLSLLVAASFEFGLSFPAGSFGQEVNIGKYLNISHQVATYRWVNVSPFVRFSRYPGITNPIPVYYCSIGVEISTSSKIWGFSGSMGLAVGMMDDSKSVINGEISPMIQRPISSYLPLYVAFSVPIMFFENVTLYGVNIGILFSL